MVVQCIVNATEGFPATFEIQGVGLVDILLALVPEAQPEAPFFNLVGGVQLNDHLGNGSHVLVGEVVFFSRTVLEYGLEVEILVERVLQGQQAVEGEALKRSNHRIGGPAHCCHVIQHSDGHCLALVVGVGKLGTALVVCLLDMEHLRGQFQPVVVEIDTSLEDVADNW